MRPTRFQSTLPREERPSPTMMRSILSIFQSTLPREERLHSEGLNKWRPVHFNPRSHERSDEIKGDWQVFRFISIHAPTRGATNGERFEFDDLINFNPRSHERSDEIQSSSGDYSQISIHAPTRGATCYCSQLPPDGRNFNPRSHERSDITLITSNRKSMSNFNPRSHERSDGKFLLI